MRDTSREDEINDGRFAIIPGLSCISLPKKAEESSIHFVIVKKLSCHCLRGWKICSRRVCHANREFPQGFRVHLRPDFERQMRKLDPVAGLGMYQINAGLRPRCDLDIFIPSNNERLCLISTPT